MKEGHAGLQDPAVPIEGGPGLGEARKLEATQAADMRVGDVVVLHGTPEALELAETRLLRG